MQIIAQSHFSDFCFYWLLCVPDVHGQELGDNMQAIPYCTALTWLVYQNKSLKVYEQSFFRIETVTSELLEGYFLK